MKADNPYFRIAVDLLTVEQSVQEAYKILDEGSLPPSAAANRVRIAQEHLARIGYELTMAQSRYASREHNIFCPIRNKEEELRKAVKDIPLECATEGCSSCGPITTAKKIVAALEAKK